MTEIYNNLPSIEDAYDKYKNSNNYYPSSFRYNEKGNLIPHEYVDYPTKEIIEYDFIKELFKHFGDIFGLFIINKDDKDKFYIEHTEGKNNILTPCKKEDLVDNHIPTNWVTNCIQRGCQKTTSCYTPKPGGKHQTYSGSHDKTKY